MSGHHIKSADEKRSQIGAEMSYDTRADSQMIQLPVTIIACQHDTHTQTHTQSKLTAFNNKRGARSGNS